jgi:hypothetical protein
MENADPQSNIEGAAFIDILNRQIGENNENSGRAVPPRTTILPSTFIGSSDGIARDNENGRSVSLQAIQRAFRTLDDTDEELSVHSDHVDPLLCRASSYVQTNGHHFNVTQTLPARTPHETPRHGTESRSMKDHIIEILVSALALMDEPDNGGDL